VININIDDLDVAIFNLLLFKKKRKYTSTQITKRILTPKNLFELRKFNTKLRYRLEKWVNGEIIKKEHKNMKDFYFSDFKNIIGGEATITVYPYGKKKIIISLGKTFLLSDKDQTHIISIKEEK